MSLGLREEKRRRKRQFRWVMLKWLLAFCVIGIAGLYAYESGSKLAQAEIGRLKEKIESLTTSVQDLENRNQQQAADIISQNQQIKEWQQRYEREVPAGDNKEVWDLAQERLAAGVDIDRLRFVIASVENERKCDPNSVTKRFIVQTPLQKGPNIAAGFADGTITVTAEGTSARDANGNPEAWFDPIKPIRVQFTLPGGKSSVSEGVLPLHPSVVVDNNEFQFSLLKGSRGFAQITSQRCDYP